VMASVLAVIDETSQLLATEDGLYVRRLSDGRLALHTPLEADNALTRSNDGRVHPSGALWVGTMGRNAERGAGAIYRLHRGELTRLYAGVTIPNAICFSPDGATAMPLGDPQILYDHRGGSGGLDGAVVDAQGLIWNARWGSGCIDVYSPAGLRVRTIRVPAKQSSCPAFVGKNFDRLLVTSAWEGMDDAAKADDPHHGHTFLLDVGAIGRPEPRVILT
jgi:sugar lactone lactonase